MTDTATFTCPECGAKAEVEIPENACLAMHECDSCHKVIKSKSGCCVICEHTDKECPYPAEEQG